MRTFSPDLLTRVVNDPSIRHMYGGDGRIDLHGVIADTENYTLVNSEGGFIFLRKAYDKFEAHTIFPKTANPLKTVRFMKNAVAYMFTRTPCCLLTTQVPGDNIGAHKLCDIMGFHEDQYVMNGWKPGVGLSYRSLPLDRWRRACSTAKEAGKDSLQIAGSFVPATKGASLCR